MTNFRFFTNKILDKEVSRCINNWHVIPEAKGIKCDDLRELLGGNLAGATHILMRQLFFVFSRL